MDKHEFLKRFFDALGNISENERNQISDYYEELICDGLEQGFTEEECVAKFGSPEEAAEKFREEYAPDIVQETAHSADLQKVFSPEESGIHTLNLSAEGVNIVACESDTPYLKILFDPNPEFDIVKTYCENGVWHFIHKDTKKSLAFS